MFQMSCRIGHETLIHIIWLKWLLVRLAHFLLSTWATFYQVYAAMEYMLYRLCILSKYPWQRVTEMLLKQQCNVIRLCQHLQNVAAPSWLGFECTWWRLLQKRVVCTRFDINVFFIGMTFTEYLSHTQMNTDVSFDL